MFPFTNLVFSNPLSNVLNTPTFTQQANPIINMDTPLNFLPTQNSFFDFFKNQNLGGILGGVGTVFNAWGSINQAKNQKRYNDEMLKLYKDSYNGAETRRDKNQESLDSAIDKLDW